MPRAKKSPSREKREAARNTLFEQHQKNAPEVPAFDALLRKPLVKDPLPANFDLDVESTHLTNLWKESPKLQRYLFSEFVYAGGSGMVFQVREDATANPRALKIVRSRVYHTSGENQHTANRISPVSELELRALEKLSHPSLVRLYEAFGDEKGVFAVCTSYVDSPLGLDEYLRTTLAKDPDPSRKKGINPFSPKRLDDACGFLIAKVSEIASAIQHMHSEKIYHFDIKPANILISGDKKAVLTDMGSSVHADMLKDGKIRVHFTWTYAHPDLTTIVHDPGSISGGGLKASASVDATKSLAVYDLFALGKTIQEALATLVNEFGERCNASYGFRFLHLLACMLLDGRNALAEETFVEKDGRKFVADGALGYPPSIFASHAIRSADELVLRLSRFSPNYSWNEIASELNEWQPDIINCVVHSPAPFTARVREIFNHPTVRRLKNEFQLGWMREIFPGATHDRWSHTLGVFSALVGYYNSLLSDPEVPTFRLFIDKGDVSHAFVAAIIHDLGQTAFGHDFEEACPFLFSHEEIRHRLLDDTTWGRPSLKNAIEKHWPEVDLKRVLSIVENNPSFGTKHKSTMRSVDGVAADAINGPIDADKLDYLLRDSTACGVPYGLGMDTQRFLRGLSVTAIPQSNGPARLGLAYKAKGRAAVTSVLLARYQMWGGVYWHHTYRCIQAMYVYAAAKAFGGLAQGDMEIKGTVFRKLDISNLFYQKVICRYSWEGSVARSKLNNNVGADFFDSPPINVREELALEFVWQFGDSQSRALVERLAKRDLYKRIYELRIGELGDKADYSAIKNELSPAARVKKATDLQQLLYDMMMNSMRERGPKESVSEDAARRRLQDLKNSSVPLIVLDFPVRGVSKDLNTPKEIGDAVRKYFVMPRGNGNGDDNIFHVVRKLQEHMAAVRLFAAPEFHELVVRYLQPAQIRHCVAEVIESIRK